MTTAELISSFRAHAGELFGAIAGALLFPAPRGRVTPDLQLDQEAAKPELLRLRRTEEVERLLAPICARLDPCAPWTAAKLEIHRTLGAAVNIACKAYVVGFGDLAAVRAAVERWESAMVDERSVLLLRRACPCGSSVHFDFKGGLRFCGRCGSEVHP